MAVDACTGFIGQIGDGIGKVKDKPEEPGQNAEGYDNCWLPSRGGPEGIDESRCPVEQI
jgi:hypothetical protein